MLVHKFAQKISFKIIKLLGYSRVPQTLPNVDQKMAEYEKMLSQQEKVLKRRSRLNYYKCLFFIKCC